MPHSAVGSPECSSFSEPGRISRSRRSLLPPFLLSVLLIISMLAGKTRTLPAGPKPRWVNPCELPGHVFDPTTDMEGAPPIRAAEIFKNVRERAFVAKKHAEDVTRKFVSTLFFFTFLLSHFMICMFIAAKFPHSDKFFQKTHIYLKFHAVLEKISEKIKILK